MSFSGKTKTALESLRLDNSFFTSEVLGGLLIRRSATIISRSSFTSLENIDLIAPLYDLDFVAFPREDLEFYQWLSETHGKNILELGVGTGRIGVGLAETGATVTGIDLSEKMIAEATKLAEKQNVEIDLIVSDMTDFELSRRFDLICAPMGTLQQCRQITEVVSTF